MSVSPHFLIPIPQYGGEHSKNNSTKNTASSSTLAALPLELVEALNQTYFLHLLVTQPEKVIPPGKSLISMTTHANYTSMNEDGNDDQDQAKENHKAIENNVKEVAHRAFWNEALEHLSSPLPSVQLPRLKQLYLDLFEALAPLFPPSHIILISLSYPLPPTSSPLHSTIVLLKEIVMALRKRCAPIRDDAVDNLARDLESLPAGSAEDHSELAKFVLAMMRKILNLGEEMRKDLNTFMLGSMTESQLKGVLTRDVKGRERDLVIKIWGGQENVKHAWREWVGQLPEESEDENRWLKRLFLALGSSHPVYTHLPPSTSTHSEAQDMSQSNGVCDATNNDTEMKSPNTTGEGKVTAMEMLPPQLLFSTPTLLYIQNYIQAIVIAGALRILARLPASGNSTSEFMQRVWPLLEMEIEGYVPKMQHTQDNDTSEPSPIKLVNLTDEVVRVRQIVSGGSFTSEDESQIRATVKRTLRATDPVFLLLRRRLVKGLEDKTLSLLEDTPKSNTTIPLKMQTGKGHIGERAGKRIRLLLPDHEEPSPRVDIDKMDGPPLPGFEDHVLRRAIAEATNKILDTVTWTAGIWGDLV